MSRDEFTKLFAHMNKRFDAIEERLEQTATRDQVDRLAGAVADLGVQLKDYHAELLALGQKVDRLERWIHQIAQETGVKLSID